MIAYNYIAVLWYFRNC